MNRVVPFLIVVCLVLTVTLTAISNEEVRTEGKEAVKGIQTRSTLMVGNGQTYSTIGAAISAASTGDTIRVLDGYYNEMIYLDKPLSLIGNGSATTFIYGPMSMGDTVTVYASGCVVDGFSITPYMTSGCAIFVNSSNNVIANCSLNAQLNAIDMYNGMNNVVQYNNISSGNEKGIYVLGGGQNRIQNNTVHDCYKSAIFLEYTTYNTLANNDIYNNGIMYMDRVIYLTNSHYNDIVNNHIHNNWLGIGLSDSDWNTITFNDISYNNYYGAEIQSNCGNNTVSKNNFIGNMIMMGMPQAYDQTHLNNWDEGYPSGGNYWDGWTAPDNYNGAGQDWSGPDGIVDLPYVLAGSMGTNGTDFYPRTTPCAIPIIITTANVPTAIEDVVYSVQYLAKNYQTVPDWALVTNAGFLGMDTNTGLLSGTPTNEDAARSYWVNVSVFSGTSSDFTNFTLDVMNVNDPPSMDLPPTFTMAEDVTGHLNISANDIDPTDDVLTWSISGAPGFLSIGPNSGVLSGTPSNSDVGNYNTTVNVSDGNGGYAQGPLEVRVQNVNDPPVMTTGDLTACDEDEFYSVQYDAYDIDPTGDKLTWHLSTDAGFLSVDAETGWLNGTPDNSEVGTHWVNVSVSDGLGGSDSSNFTLTVNNVNDDPIVQDPTDEIVFDEDTQYQLDLAEVFSDPDGDTLAYDPILITNITSSIATNGIATLTPAANWSGTEEITFFAHDAAEQATAKITFVVTQVNDEPYGANIELPLAKYIQGGNQTAIGHAEDVDIIYGDMLSYSWMSNTTGNLGAGQSINLSLPKGWHLITINVTDLAGKHCVYSTEVEVFGPSTIPVDDDTDDDVDDDTDDDFVEPNATDDDDNNMLSNAMFVIIPVLILLVIIIIIIVLVMRSRKKKAEESPKKKEETSTIEAEVDTEDLFQQKAVAKAVKGKAGPSTAPKPVSAARDGPAAKGTPEGPAMADAEQPAEISAPEMATTAAELEVTEPKKLMEDDIYSTPLVKRTKPLLALPPATVFDADFDAEHKIDEIFIINKAGLLIKHFKYKDTSIIDEDILASMLTVIQNFVSDSFGKRKTSLKKLEFGEFKILIIPGNYLSAVLISQDEDLDDQEDPAKHMIKEVESLNAGILKDWDGDQSKIDGIDVCVNKLVHGEY